MPGIRSGHLVGAGTALWWVEVPSRLNWAETGMRRTLTTDGRSGRRRLLAVLSAMGLATGGLVAGLGPVTAQAAPAEKVQVCHYNPYVGEWQVNTVKDNGKALQAHLDHGDAQPGEPVPGMDGYTFDDTCTPIADPAPETIWAVAYIDNVDDGAAYDPAVDTLIVKVVDDNGGNPNGVPDAGDTIVQDSYPTSCTAPFNPAPLPGNTTETVTSTDLLNGDFTAERTVKFLDRSGESVSWSGNWTGNVPAVYEVNDDGPGMLDRVVLVDGTLIFLCPDPDGSDDPFLDVDINY